LSLRILIISDNEAFAAYLGRLLLAVGHATSSLPAGKEALRAVRAEKPDLLIVAAQAAKVAGLAVEQRLQTAQGPRTVPLIVISDSPALEAELVHAFDFLPQPLDVGRLLDDVAVIARRPAQDALPAPLSDQQYQAFSAHLLSSTGLHFEKRNRHALERGIHKRMSTLCMAKSEDYLGYLKRHGESRQELQKLLQFLTVGETYFFRYPSQFEALREGLLTGCAASHQPIRIWSAGCSTGEEAYSIAITVMEALPDWRTRDVRIIASDLNQQSLARAREGVYNQWALRTTEQHHLDRYFEQGKDGFRIKDEVKRLVEFQQMNLSGADDAPFGGSFPGFDAIFCRNVLIYFSPGAAARALGRFAELLKTSGQLFLGHAETIVQRAPDLEIRQREESFYFVKSPAPVGSEPEPQPEPQRSPPPPKLSTLPPLPALPPLLLPEEEPVPAAARLEEARRLFDAEELERAWQVLEELLRDEPEHSGALVLQGFLLASLGRLQEALDTCCRAVALDDLLPEAYFLKGVVLDAWGRLEEAADEYRKALLLDHDFIMPRFYMGRLHLRLGKLPEGAREIRNSIRILSRRPEEGTVPFSGGLTRAACLKQLKSALDQVA